MQSNFLRDQHDLIMRVMAAKSTLEAEKSAFDAQRQQDVARLKMEAEQLDHKLKEVVGPLCMTMEVMRRAFKTFKHIKTSNV